MDGFYIHWYEVMMIFGILLLIYAVIITIAFIITNYIQKIIREILSGYTNWLDNNSIWNQAIPWIITAALIQILIHIASFKYYGEHYMVTGNINKLIIFITLGVPIISLTSLGLLTFKYNSKWQVLGHITRKKKVWNIVFWALANVVIVRFTHTSSLYYRIESLDYIQYGYLTFASTFLFYSLLMALFTYLIIKYRNMYFE